MYQILISPVIGGNRCCRFSPTCSSYAIDAIKKLGIFRGLIFASWRILRCNPWGGRGYDPVMTTKTIRTKIRTKKNLTIFLIVIISQSILNSPKLIYAQTKITNLSKDDDIISQLKKETEQEESALKPDLESLGLDRIDSVVKGPDTKTNKDPDAFLTKKQNNKSVDNQQKIAPVSVLISETPKEQFQKEKGFFEKKLSDITAEPIKKIKELIGSDTEKKTNNIKTKGDGTQNEVKVEITKTESDDKKNADAKNKLDNKRKKAEERKKKQIALAEFLQKQKTKKIEELRKKYLQENNDDIYEEISRYQSLMQIIPQPKAYPKFLNSEIPPPLLNRFRGEENRHHPIMMSNSEKVDFMFKAIAENRIDEFNSLFSLVKDPNIKNSSGDTLLTFAILMRKYDAISSLLSKGANPDLSNDLGYTPLNIAIEIIDYKSTELLVSMGANVNLFDDLGRTYLMQSSRVGSLPITDLLVSKGVDVNISDKNGTTALAIAYRHKKDIIAKYLLKFGAKSWIKKSYANDDTLMVDDLFNKWK